ncbi:MAG TPA: hypothetical protein EYP19_09815 [Desulfobacterales bacterium]|nr:hypothetical protein [Desulfobacterales bacterium]
MTVPGADPYHLLLYSTEVKEELGLTKGQIHRLIRADRGFFSRLSFSADPVVPDPGRNLPPEQSIIEKTEQFNRHIEKTKGVIATVLTERQTRRLQQITLQINGPCIFLTDQELAVPLRITPDQATQVNRLCRRLTNQMRADARRETEGSSRTERCMAFRAKRERMKQLRMDTEQHIFDLFSNKQKALYASLVGAPFWLDPEKGPPCPH